MNPNLCPYCKFPWTFPSIAVQFPSKVDGCEAHVIGFKCTNCGGVTEITVKKISAPVINFVKNEVRGDANAANIKPKNVT